MIGSRRGSNETSSGLSPHATINVPLNDTITIPSGILRLSPSYVFARTMLPGASSASLVPCLLHAGIATVDRSESMISSTSSMQYVLITLRISERTCPSSTCTCTLASKMTRHRSSCRRQPQSPDQQALRTCDHDRTARSNQHHYRRTCTTYVIQTVERRSTSAPPFERRGTSRDTHAPQRRSVVPAIHHPRSSQLVALRSSSIETIDR